MWPDPSDPLCPAEFKATARELLPQILGKIGPADDELRKALLKFIADFANWDNAAHPAYLEVSRALVKAAHGEEPPLVEADLRPQVPVGLGVDDHARVHQFAALDPRHPVTIGPYMNDPDLIINKMQLSLAMAAASSTRCAPLG